MRIITIAIATCLTGACIAQTSDLVSANTGSDVITKGATMLLKTADFEKLRTELSSVALKHHGIIADSKTNVSPKGRKHGWFRISVPADQIESLLTDIRPVAKVVGEESKTSNRKPEIDELDLRRQNVINHVDRLKSSLTSRKSIRGSDVLFMEDKIFRAETDRDLLLNDRKKIEGTVANASIVVSAYEPGTDVTPPPAGPSKLTAGVVSGFKTAILDSATQVVTIVKWLVMLLIAIPLYRRFKPGPVIHSEGRSLCPSPKDFLLERALVSTGICVPIVKPYLEV